MKKRTIGPRLPGAPQNNNRKWWKLRAPRIPLAYMLSAVGVFIACILAFLIWNGVIEVNKGLVIVLVLTALTLFVMYFSLWAIATGFAKTDTFWTKFPLQGFMKFVKKGNVIVAGLLSNDSKRYDLKTDTIKTYSPEELPYIKWRGFWYWIAALKFIGLRHSVEEFTFDRHIMAITDTNKDGENEIVIKEVDTVSTEMPLAIDLIIEAHNFEVSKGFFAFFKLSIRLSVKHPLKYLGLLRAKNAGNKKVIALMLAKLKVYSRSKTIEQILEEDTTSDKNSFIMTMLSVNENTALAEGEENVDSLSYLTGLVLESVELIDFGNETGAGHEAEVDSAKQDQIEVNLGKAKVTKATYNLKAAEINLAAKKLENEGLRDEIKSTVIAAQGAEENFKYLQIAKSNITALVEGGNANLNLPVNPPKENKSDKPEDKKGDQKKEDPKKKKDEKNHKHSEPDAHPDVHHPEEPHTDDSTKPPTDNDHGAHH